MSNMSHCRFQNTLSDLRDCLDALDQDDIMIKLSKDESRAALSLVETCVSVINVFGGGVANYDEFLTEARFRIKGVK
jgi:hypothetical protein